MLSQMRFAMASVFALRVAVVAFVCVWAVLRVARHDLLRVPYAMTGLAHVSIPPARRAAATTSAAATTRATTSAPASTATPCPIMPTAVIHGSFKHRESVNTTWTLNIENVTSRVTRDPDTAFHFVQLERGRGVFHGSRHTHMVWSEDGSPEELYHGLRWQEPPAKIRATPCDVNITEPSLVLGTNHQGRWQYGHVLHDLLPWLIYLHSSYPTGRMILQDGDGVLPGFLEWFDVRIHRRAVYVRTGKVFCAPAGLGVLVPLTDFPDFRLQKIFIGLHAYLQRLRPHLHSDKVVYYTRVSQSDIHHGRTVTKSHSAEISRIARQGMQKHGRTEQLVEFNGRSGTGTMSFHDQYALFASASLAFGPHGTGFANILWMQTGSGRACDERPAAVEFVCSPRSLNVSQCNHTHGGKTYWALEGTAPWLRYFHVFFTEDSTNFYVRVDLEGFRLALDLIWR